MKKWIVCLAVLLSACMLAGAAVADVLGATSMAENLTSARISVMGQIVKVDVRNNKVSVVTKGEDAGKMIFLVDDKTSIKKASKQVPLSSLKTGDQVALSYVKPTEEDAIPTAIFIHVIVMPRGR